MLHGLSVNGTKHPIYKLRERMIHYCYKIDSSNKNYPYYRGKGIRVCDEWQSDVSLFHKWCLENGWEKGLSIDRIDSNGDYCPDNCRFITLSENSKKARMENDQRGENGPLAKLTNKHVVIIRSLAGLGYPHRKIASFFGVCKTTISYIISNKTWINVKT